MIVCKRKPDCGRRYRPVCSTYITHAAYTFPACAVHVVGKRETYHVLPENAYLCSIMKKRKYYVVWEGVTPGIYTDWARCRLQTKGYAGAKFKSFETREEAEKAFASSPYEYIGQNSNATTDRKPCGKTPPSDVVAGNAIAVDAACSGNPGKMEYRGIQLPGRRQVFHYGPVYGTNNIGEFLAIVHALALIKQHGLKIPVYSDSVNAINWVRRKKCKTRLLREPRTETVFRLIERAEKWLQENDYTSPVLKWETDKWGEIPADFGRK